MLRLIEPASPNAAIGLAGLRVQREEPAVVAAEHDLRRGLRVAGPVLDAARRRRAVRHRKRPQLLAGRGIERDDAAVRRGDEHDAVDDHRSDLTDRETGTPAAAAPASSRRRGRRFHRGGRRGRRHRRGPHVIHPRDLQLPDIGRGELRERREALAAAIVVVGGPLGRGRRWLRGRRLRGRGRVRQAHQRRDRDDEYAGKSLHLESPHSGRDSTATWRNGDWDPGPGTRESGVGTRDASRFPLPASRFPIPDHDFPSRNKRRRILPDGDFGIASMNSSLRIFFSLELGGRHLHALVLNQLLQPIDDEEVAVSVGVADVAGVQPAVVTAGGRRSSCRRHERRGPPRPPAACWRSGCGA